MILIFNFSSKNTRNRKPMTKSARLKAVRAGIAIPCAFLIMSACASSAAGANGDTHILAARDAEGNIVSRDYSRSRILNDDSHSVTADGNYSATAEAAAVTVSYFPSTGEIESLAEAIQSCTSLLQSADSVSKDLKDKLETACLAAQTAQYNSADDYARVIADIKNASDPVTDAMSKAELAAKEAAEASRKAAQKQAAAAADSIQNNSGTIISDPTGDAIAELASRYAGKVPYVSGGADTNGWDCSGMVMWVFAQFGISLPHYSGAMASMGEEVSSLSKAQSGDIICNNAHAAIYLGNGLCINAMNPSMGTRIVPVSAINTFADGYSIRRMI